MAIGSAGGGCHNGNAPSIAMPFSILDHLDALVPAKESGKYICPACQSNNLSINKTTGAYTCFQDPSPKHRAEIRNTLAPMERWEKPRRQEAFHQFHYQNKQGDTIVVVNRKDDGESDSKRIWQDFPTIDTHSPSAKLQLQEAKATILPYRYHEATKASNENGLPIFIVEGELKADAIWDIGLPAISFLGGSKQYRSNGDYSTIFRDYRLVLCPDRDEPGVAFMKEVEADNPGAQWLYPDSDSWEWDNLPGKNGYDIGDWIESEGATKEDLLSAIVSKGRHQNADGKPGYDEIISSIEDFVGLFGNNDARIYYETASWLERKGIKMPQQNIDKLVDEAKGRVHGREAIETIDALTIANSDQCREWLIAGIVPQGTVMLLAAQGGCGKSSLLYNWALSIALGKPWSNRRCAKGKVLIIQSDEPLVDTTEKLAVIGYADAGLEPGMISFWENWRFAHIKQLEEFIRKHRPSFVVIDSLTSCLSGMNIDLTKSSSGDVIYGLRDLANQYQCSIVILHHLNKTGGLRDSSAFVDNVSEVIKFNRMEGGYDNNQFTLEWLKSRAGLSGKHVLTREPMNYGWRYGGPLGGSLDELEAVVTALGARRNERLSCRQVAAIVGSWDISGTRKMLEVARRQGLITSSWQTGPNGERDRLYHDWNYSAVIENPTKEGNADAEAEDDDFF